MTEIDRLEEVNVASGHFSWQSLHNGGETVALMLNLIFLVFLGSLRLRLAVRVRVKANN